MQKYYSAIRKNDLKADSIINEINQDRSLRGLPIYDVKIRTIYSADDKHEDYWDFKQTYSYGACRFTDKDSFFAEGILFYLHQPEIVAPIKIHILADEYIGYVEDIWECFHIKFREKD